MKFWAMKSSLFALATASVSVGAAPAMGQESSAVLAAFAKLMDYSGYEMGFKDVETDGDTITVNNTRARLKNTESMEPIADEVPFDLSKPVQLPVPLIFEGVSEADNGDYMVDKIYLPQMEFSADEVDVTIGEFAYGGATIPAGEIDFLDLFLWVTSSSIGPIDVTIEDIEAFKIAPITSQNDVETDENGELVSVTSTVDMPSATFLIQNSPEPIEEPFDIIIGDQNIEASMSAEFFYSPADGRMTYKTFRMGAQDLGQFEFTFDVSGITGDVLAQLVELSQGGIDPEDPQVQAELMEMGMGLAATTFFHSISIRYEDFGGLDRYFSWVEEDEGMTRAEMAEELLNEAGEMFLDLELDAEYAMLETAITDFLTDTQSIELRIEPETPLPLISFMGLAATPKVLAQTLNASLVANQ